MDKVLPKIIVAHPGKQHSFRLASALAKKGMLLKYITTVYDKPSSFLMRVVKKFISSDNKKRAGSRRNPDLNDNQVVQFRKFAGLIEIFLARFDKSRKLYDAWQFHNANKFGKKVAKFAIKHKADVVITYDMNAMRCFEYLQKKAPNIIRVMDVSAANRLYMKDIYDKEMDLNPLFCTRLRKEIRFLWKKSGQNRLLREIKATQYFLAPSEFVKKSLFYSGVTKSQVYVCPFGIGMKKVDRKYNLDENRPLELIYVGNVTAIKGVKYLLDAVLRFSPKQVHLTVVGHYDNSDNVFDKYISSVTFTGRVLPAEVAEKLTGADVFVFPSLGEGMSLSCLEAMSSGLPCILTCNSGANDLINDGENGFVIEPQSVEQIVEKIQWFLDNRSQIAIMGKNAQEIAQKYNWTTYENRVVEYIEEILN